MFEPILRKAILICLLIIPLFSSAMINQKQQDSIAKMLKDKTGINDAYLSSVLDSSWDHFPSTLKLLDSIEIYIKQRNLKCLLGRVYYHKGINQYHFANGKNGVLSFTKSVEYSKKCKDTFTELNAMFEMGKLYNSRGFSSTALNWHKKTYLLAQNYTNLAILFRAKAQLAKSLSENNFSDSAIQLLNELIDSTKKHKNEHYLGRAYLYLSLAYANKLDTQKVIENCYLALPLLKNNDRFYSFTLRILSEYLNLTDPKKALLFANQARIYAPNTIIRSQLFNTLKNAYFYNQKFDSAYYYFELMQAAKDTLFNLSNINEMAAINEKYLKELSEKEVEKIKMENEIQKKTKNIWIVISVSLLLTFLIIMYSYFKIKEKNNQLVHEIKNKEILLKEVNHRVKNNLQLMSSLFSIQQHKTDDVKLHESLNTAKNRIIALSLFHNILNQEDNLQTINIKDILHSTINQIIEIYQSPERHIELIFESNNTEKSFDFLMQLGLVLNELIANSVKHNQGLEKLYIYVSAMQIENKFVITYFDGGKGFDVSNFSNPTTTGLLLIKNIITNQIKGKIDLLKENNILKYKIEI